ncbi:unnamed protein product [Onchocerca flexuosa]|uniref:Ovule protein n=1 Tax=Onchocerca flexuosa TaxID=387005 RepID=A0A183H082_9BILA|nr:unnamed protein product [Onchocerca flexuosa]
MKNQQEKETRLWRDRSLTHCVDCSSSSNCTSNMKKWYHLFRAIEISFMMDKEYHDGFTTSKVFRIGTVSRKHTAQCNGEKNLFQGETIRTTNIDSGGKLIEDEHRSVHLDRERQYAIYLLFMLQTIKVMTVERNMERQSGFLIVQAGKYGTNKLTDWL